MAPSARRSMKQMSEQRQNDLKQAKARQTARRYEKPRCDRMPSEPDLSPSLRSDPHGALSLEICPCSSLIKWNRLRRASGKPMAPVPWGADILQRHIPPAPSFSVTAVSHSAPPRSYALGWVGKGELLTLPSQHKSCLTFCPRQETHTRCLCTGTSALEKQLKPWLFHSAD